MTIRSLLVQDLKSVEQKYIILGNRKDCLHCGNCFDHDDKYQPERKILAQIKSVSKIKANTKQKGDLLEDLMRKLFHRFDLAEPYSRNTCDTGIGQVDLILTAISDEFYEILGLKDKPKGIVGECKNYKPSKALGRPIVEQMCWRSIKGGSLILVVAKEFTKDSQKEISFFNGFVRTLKDHPGNAILIPITLEMIDVVLNENINFCYFLRWAIQGTQNNMAISNYLIINGDG